MPDVYFTRKSLSYALKAELDRVKDKFIQPGENESYEIGKHLGYTDALHFAIALVEGAQVEEARKGQHSVYGRPETFPE